MSDQPSVYKPSDLTYGSYLKVPELLALQELKSDPPHHDELLFIVIHQAYELWFKMILYELENTMAYMAKGEVLRANHFMRRVVEIQKLLVGQIHILETMTPIEFLGFRGHINPASGFQSFQFREMEFMAGLVDPAYYDHFIEQAGMESLRKRAEQPSLWQAYQTLLKDLGFDVPPPLPNDPPEGAERTQLLMALKTLYEAPQARMDLYLLTEALVDFDAQLALWRFHHVNVVERVIGMKPGTGGSSGSGYLRGTLVKRAFPVLYEVRGILGQAPGDPPPPPATCPFPH